MPKQKRRYEQVSQQRQFKPEPQSLKLQASRPFAAHPESPEQVKTQREQQASLGHNFSDIAVGTSTPSPGVNTFPLQAKLTLGKPNDKYEQEADRVAAHVVQQLNHSQTQLKADTVQRETLPEEEELPMKPHLQRHTVAGEIAPELEDSIQQVKGSGQPLNATIQTKMSQAMGADFSGVRIHTNSQAHQLNQSIQAKAFTTGQDVFFRQGAYQPGSQEGQKLIAHELTHVVQQNHATSLPTVIQAKVGGQADSLTSLAEKRFQSMRTRGVTGHSETAQAAAQELRDYLIDQSNHSNDQDISQTFHNLLRGNGIDTSNYYNFNLAVEEAIRAIPDAEVKEKITTFYQDHRTNFRRSKGMSDPHRVDQYYLKTRENITLDQGYLDDNVRNAFSDALKTMPTIAYLLDPNSNQNQNRFVPADTPDQQMQQGQKKLAQWRNNTSILDNINIQTGHTRLLGLGTVPDQELQAMGVKRGALEQRLRQAERFLQQLIEPEILGKLDAPRINVKTKKSIKADTTAGMGLKLIAGYQRPYQDDGEVTIGYNEKVSLIAHEIGHYIEDNSSNDLWHENQLLLRKRHEEKGGGKLVGHNLLKGKKGGLPTESRYRGKYAGTGQYTSRYYGDGGSTEVTSLSFEFLSEPRKALDLINKDPLQAAIVLRQVCPQEYQNTNALRPFDQHLPH